MTEIELAPQRKSIGCSQSELAVLMSPASLARRCAWCEREAGTAVAREAEDGPVTHGICDGHVGRLMTGLSQRGATPWLDVIR